jgi:hypothetical protein
MKHRSPQGRVTHVAAPVEPVQGAQPSADYTRASRQLVARQNQSGRVRQVVKVEGMGEGRVALDMARVSVVGQRAQELVQGAGQQAAQARGLANSLTFEERARAAGAIGRPSEAQEFRQRVKAAERAHVYQRPR